MSKIFKASAEVSRPDNSGYEDFWGLSRNPFHVSPDPFFMISSKRVDEALASISRAVRQRKGFVVMTGEVGTGKTLVLRYLAEIWEREETPFAYFIGARLSTVDFLRYITCELGINVTEPTKGNLLRALYEFLQRQFEKGLTTVLIIDEAHQMPRGVLEEIRLLTNFESAQQKLVQIVLVGQPELDKKLDLFELRALRQRIAVRCQLEPLREDEIHHYVVHRLELAGAGSQANTIFPMESVRAIYRYSRGVPRLVNSICDQALVAACAQQVRVVPVEVIKEAAYYFRLTPVPNLQQIIQPSIMSEVRPTRPRQFQTQHWLIPALRVALTLSVAGVVPTALSTGVIMAHRQQEAVTLPNQDLSTEQTLQVGRTALSVQPREATSAVRVGVGTGDHAFTVKKNGYEPSGGKLKTSTGEADIAANSEAVGELGQKTETVVSLTPSEPSAPQRDTGKDSSEVLVAISFASDPNGADINIDDSFVGKTPMTLQLKPGKHAIRMFMSDYHNWARWITVEAGSDLHIAATLTSNLTESAR